MHGLTFLPVQPNYTTCPSLETGFGSDFKCVLFRFGNEEEHAEVTEILYNVWLLTLQRSRLHSAHHLWQSGS